MEYNVYMENIFTILRRIKNCFNPTMSINNDLNFKLNSKQILFLIQQSGI